MTGWMVAPGTWRMSGPGIAPRTFTFERSTSVALAFAPHRTSVVDFELVKAGPPPAERPDLGIGEADVAVNGQTVTLTVHSLGAQEARGGTASLLDAKGRVLATAPVPALAAPLDLIPKTATVTLPLKPGAVRVRVALDGPEVTLMNNEVALPGEAPKPADTPVKHHRKK